MNETSALTKRLPRASLLLLPSEVRAGRLLLETPTLKLPAFRYLTSQLGEINFCLKAMQFILFCYSSPNGLYAEQFQGRSCYWHSFYGSHFSLVYFFLSLSRC